MASTATAPAEPRLPSAPGEDLPAEQPRFEALAPVNTAGNLKSLLERSAAVLQAVLPRHVTPERLWRTLLVAANRNPDILRCTQASVIECITRAGELGLDLSGTMGEAYAVPFNNKVTYTDASGQKRETWAMQLTMIPGYRGLAKLARQSGEVARLEAEVVREGDHFVYRKTHEGVTLEWSPKLDGERGRARGAYALIGLRDGSVLCDYMTVAEVEKVRQKAKSKDSPAWRDWWEEMARKTVFRRLSKWAPLSSEKFQQAITSDNIDVDVDSLLPTIDVSPTARTEALADRLAGTDGDNGGDQAIEAPEGDGGESSEGRAPGSDDEPSSAVSGELFSGGKTQSSGARRR